MSDSIEIKPAAFEPTPGAPASAAAPAGANDPLTRALEDARRELLDLTTRNRLLDTPRRRTRSSSIEIVDELSAEIFRILVTEEKAMSFLPREEEMEEADHAEKSDDDEEAVESRSPDSDDETSADRAGSAPHLPDAVDESPGETTSETSNDSFTIGDFDGEEPLFDLPQPDETAEAAGELDLEGTEAGEGPAEPLPHHVDRHLQTDLPSNVLQSRLLRQFYDARTYQEEQGVSILFLALGFIQWYDPAEPSRARHAPLILIPVELDRTSARSRFRIRWTGEDITTNLSLQVKLKHDFGVDLPDVPPTEDLDVAAYLAEVGGRIEHLDNWQVLADDMVLWFFSFAKLLMYRDLDPSNWPADKQLTDRLLVRALLADGFVPAPPLCDDEAFVDEVIPPECALHIMDADSSQAIAIEEARRGRDLIIQGPPGTGKSQTITNIIAAAVCAGKKVLFVAEKAAALEVVKRRLANVGLGDMCLELHSNKAKKRELVEELAETLALNKPVCDDASTVTQQLAEARDRLNAHCATMHEPDEPSGLTPYRVLGELIRLRDEGVPPTDFDLPEAAQWTPGDVRTREALLEELASFVREIGPPNEHPWRGVMLDASLPNDRLRFQEGLPAVIETINAFRGAADEMAEHLHAERVSTIADAARLCAQARRFAAAPEMDRHAMADTAWAQHREDIARLVEQGRVYATRRTELEPKVVEAAWTIDWTETRLDIASFGRSLFRFLSGPYRRAMKRLKGVMRDGAFPKSVDDRLALLDGLIEARRARDTIDAASDLGQRAFGSMWAGEGSDFDDLAAIEAWERECSDDDNMPGDFRQRLKDLPAAEVLNHAADATESAAGNAERSLQSTFDAISLDVDRAFSDDAGRAVLSVQDVALDTVIERIGAWRNDPESIARWIAYRQRDERARELGLTPLCDVLYDGRLSPGNALPRFRMTYFEIILRRLVQHRPGLGAFDGLAHERIRTRFRELDERRIELARQQTALAHYERIPRGVSEIGEIGLIRREAKKRRRHLPIRQLLREAGNAITEIKPVVMMSPLSIAQYVEPGALEFDVLIFDEASQVRPVDALGAAARAKQMIVVGDDRQLPPTRFFSRSIDDLDLDETDVLEQRAGDLESILGLCHAQSMPGRMLRWHYRSRHQSLIAVSNREFYEGKLNVVPSPVRAGSAMGVLFHHLPHAVYDRGGTATNPEEARALAEAVMRHAEQSPDLTLGVGAFSIKQRDAIIDELERLRRARPDLESFFMFDGPEPFFVKNLENIQGDERDVIFISVGFGRDADGHLTMNFGPLSNEGGERRLNVLITRARTRCEVFSSMTTDDIDLDRATGRGPAAFKAYLRFAQTGSMPRDHEGDSEVESVFERQVAAALKERGHEVDARIGDSGFFVDLAVRDPQDSAEYLLGIESDGRGYRAARWARDRDRIHPNVLEFRGWKVHRLWATDWFSRPQEQLDGLLNTIEQANSRAAVRASSGAKDSVAIERENGGAAEPCTISTPYVEAKFRVPRRTEIHEMPVERLADFALRIVEIEQPIHIDEIAQRMTSLWGQSRTGRRISSAVEAAVNQLQSGGGIVVEDGFARLPDAAEPPVRSRAEVESRTLRRIEMIAPAEIRRCLELLIEHHFGVTRDEAAVATARELGFKLTSAQLRDAIDRQIDALVDTGRVLEVDGRLQLAQPPAGGDPAGVEDQAADG